MLTHPRIPPRSQNLSGLCKHVLIWKQRGQLALAVQEERPDWLPEAEGSVAMPHVPRMPHWGLGCGFPTLALLFCWDVRKRAPKLRKKGISFLFYHSSTVGRLFWTALCSHVRIGHASETGSWEMGSYHGSYAGVWLAVGGIQSSGITEEEQEGTAELAIFTS